jgi:hypothetical protein
VNQALEAALVEMERAIVGLDWSRMTATERAVWLRDARQSARAAFEALDSAKGGAA